MNTAADDAELERIYADTTGTTSSKYFVGGNNDFLGFVLSQFWFLFLTQKTVPTESLLIVASAVSA